MSSNHVRNTNGLKEYAQSKKDEVISRVDSAIQKLIVQNKPVNFNSISIEAKVSLHNLWRQFEIEMP